MTLVRKIRQNQKALIILMIGLVVIAGVSMFAVSKSTDDQAPLLQEQQDKTIVKKKSVKPKRSFERQTSIAEIEIEGSWRTQLDGMQALLQMRGRTYKLIVVPNNPVEARYYSNGTYILKEDLLILTPNMAWGPPKSRRFAYDVLTLSDLPVLVSKHQGKLVWQLPSYDSDIYVPNFHQILSRTEDNIAVWDVLK